jgi:hypothetical protein
MYTRKKKKKDTIITQIMSFYIFFQQFDWFILVPPTKKNERRGEKKNKYDPTIPFQKIIKKMPERLSTYLYPFTSSTFKLYAT